MSRPDPIVVRPRKDSELERMWVEEGRNNAAMRDYIHSWAVMFKQSQADKADGKEEE